MKNSYQRNCVRNLERIGKPFSELIANGVSRPSKAYPRIEIFQERRHANAFYHPMNDEGGFGCYGTTVKQE